MRDRAAWNKTAFEKSQGLTVIGLIMVLFILIVLLLFGMKLLPAYIEYATAKKAINAIARDGTGASTPAEVRRQFDARALIDNVESIKGTDLEIRREGGGVVIGFAYRKEVPLVANLGLYIDFAANSAGQ
jgi:competence protein ComGC